MSYPDKVTIVEVGPRDGLQNESQQLDTPTKVKFINELSETGLSVIESTSFVSAKAIPQLADHASIYDTITKKENTRYPVLVPNLQGYHNALKLGVKEISLFTAVSDTFTQRNIHCSVDESLARFKPIIKSAIENKLRIRAYVSCVIACPYEGPTEPNQVLTLSQQLLELGCHEISLGDTIGVATPNQVKDLLNCLSKDISVSQLAVHFHDTYGQAIANIVAALEHGISVVDSSVAGLGGCPYAKGATGNVATEDVIYLLNGLGIETGVELEKLIEVSRFISHKLNKPNNSKVTQAKS